MTGRFSCVFALAALFLISSPVSAQEQQKPGGAAPHIFAFPGAECPAASRPYQGPENDAAMKQGAIYCVFARTSTRVAKADFDGACPPDMKLAKEEGDYLWCALPQDAIFDVHRTVNLGTSKDPVLTNMLPLVPTIPGEAPAPVMQAVPETPVAPETPPETPVAAKPSLGARFKAWFTNILP